ncbi:hypothetical protein LCGC14_1265410 [marine sediment metagenome]|uniref:ATP-dependent Clp protease proteolytic subunit n=1 Tax=marine sediment metagenome TaxID=412755 RepID=A0A0F9NGF8_9ZZZZ|nr:hypothetical protein [Desulfobacterales bacterium]
MKKRLILFTVCLLLFFGCDKTKMPYGVGVKNGVGSFVFKGTIASTYIPDALKYFSKNNIRQVVIEVHSPGGSLFEVWRIISLLESYDNEIKYQTRALGLAGSGGFMVFLAGDERLVSRHASFMWHNTKGYGIDEEANKMFDDRSNAYIASRTDMTIDQVREKIKNGEKDWYFGAKEAIALGIAHGYIE